MGIVAPYGIASDPGNFVVIETGPAHGPPSILIANDNKAALGKIAAGVPN